MDEETRKEIQEWLKDKSVYTDYTLQHDRLKRGVELILRVLLEKEKL